MILDFKPMLAAGMRKEKGETIESLTYPLIASAKIDGIRCAHNGKPLTRSLKAIPNRHVSKLLDSPLLRFLDGELLIGEGDNFQAVTSGIMSHDGEPEFTFHVFDWFGHPNSPYHWRVEVYQKMVAEAKNRLPFLRAVPVEHVRNAKELEDFSARCLEQGYEGAMVRKPDGPYKFGRSTLKEGFLVKVKPFEDDEATVVGFEEQMHNANEATTNELGRTRRSSHKANKIPKGTLGALVVNHPTFGEFNVGTGFDDALRQQIWNNRSAYLGRTVTFRYQVAGMKDKPRIPAFKGFRDARDM